MEDTPPQDLNGQHNIGDNMAHGYYSRSLWNWIIILLVLGGLLNFAQRCAFEGIRCEAGAHVLVSRISI
jgi:hypothetical protein